jgi:hypothetical protein
VKFKILDEIRDIEVIARGHGIRELSRLRRLYGGSNWRKMKGVATIEYADGTICLAELHWYEAHGIVKTEIRDKRVLRHL